MATVELNETTKTDVIQALAFLGPGGPIVLVAASDSHAELLDNWLCHMVSLDIRRLIVVAMDARIATRLTGSGLAVVRGQFDGTSQDFWLQRARLCAFLADEGIEFIHSDTDAVWLNDPRSHYAGTDCDLFFSQGTDMPQEALSAWGFVLCCGFFWARPTPPTRALLHALVTPQPGSVRFDDQIILNQLLVREGMEWDKRGTASYHRQFRHSAFTCFADPILGNCRSLGLRILLLPHHAFPRLDTGTRRACVRHILSSKEAGVPVERAKLMAADGCWKLDAHPNGFILKH